MWRRLSLALALFAAFICIGTIGYVILEDWSFLDSFYMTLITLSTVGFGEIKSLSPAGRLFTSFLILGGIGTAAYLFSTITETVVSGQLREVLGERRNRKLLEKLQDHYIVCGYGEVGRRVCELLAAEGRPFAVIEADSKHLETFRRKEIPYVLGNAIEKENLLAAGVERAQGLFASLGDSSKNIYLSLLAKSINPRCRVVVRNEGEADPLIIQASKADAMVRPTYVGAGRMFLAMVRPHVTDLLEEIMIDRADHPEEVLIAAYHIQKETSLEKLGIKTIKGVYAVLLKKKNGERNFEIDETEVLQPGDTILVIGHEQDLKEKLDSLKDILA